MKLSLVFELLLIFVLLAFAASKSVKKQVNNKKVIQNRNDENKIEDNSINKYCKCVEAYCNCCRDFAVPVIKLNGPGCATLRYLNGDKLSVSLRFGKKVIANRTLTSRKPTPVCMPLPGGVSKFCGRVYNIARAGEEFRACLGLELQAKSTVEAAVRVSCFKFGPRGVISEPADPLPLVPQDEIVDTDDDDEDDDDDDEDEFGLEDDDDDDDDDEDDDGDLDATNDVDGDDYTAFSLLEGDILGDIFGSSGSKKPNKNKKKQAPTSSTTTTTTTKRPRITRRTTRRPITRVTTPRPVRTTTPRIRPVSRRPTRRPTRRPITSRPNRKPSTAESSSSPSTLEELPTKGTPAMIPVLPSIQTTEEIQSSTEKLETIPSLVSVIPVQKVIPTMTTQKSVTDLDDPNLAMSLAHITGQLSVMPVTPPLANEVKVHNVPLEDEELIKFEKIETITPKTSSTTAFDSNSEEAINDDMIQIVQNLDSQPEDTTEVEQDVKLDESRGHHFNYGFAFPGVTYEGLTLPKKKHRGAEFTIEDLDVLDLTQIGEGIGQELGIFDGKKRQQKHHNKDKDNKFKTDDKSNELDDIVDVFDTMGEVLTVRKSDTGNAERKGRKRQNKMMRGWPLV